MSAVSTPLWGTGQRTAAEDRKGRIADVHSAMGEAPGCASELKHTLYDFRVIFGPRKLSSGCQGWAQRTMKECVWASELPHIRIMVVSTLSTIQNSQGCAHHTVYTLHLDIETFSGQGLGNQTAFKPWLLVILVRTTRDLIFLSFIFLICKNRANECIGCWGKENKIMYPIVCYNAKNSINGSYYCLHFSLKSKGIVWGRDF